MKKALSILAGILLASSVPFAAQAAPTSWDFASNVLQPLQSAWGAIVKGDHFVATSTSQASVFPYASSTVSSANTVCISTDCRTVWPSGSAPGGASSTIQYNSNGTLGGLATLITDGTKLFLNSLFSAYGGITTSNITATSTATSTIANLGGVLDASTFSGADICAQINSAYAALPSTGGRIFVPTGTYSCTTPIVFGTNKKIVYLFAPSGGGASNNGIGGTTITYTPTTGIAITWNTNNYIAGGSGIENINLQGTNGTTARATTGIRLGGTNGAFSFTLLNANISGFGLGWDLYQNTSFITAINSVIHFNGVNIFIEQTTGANGENFKYFGGVVADSNNQTGGDIDLYCIHNQLSGNTQVSFIGTSIDDCSYYDDQSGGTANETNFTDVHWENPNGHSYPYIQTLANIPAIEITMSGGDMMNDDLSGMPEFILSGGDISFDGTVFNGNNNVLNPVTTAVVLDNSNNNASVAWHGVKNNGAVGSTLLAITNIYSIGSTVVPFSPEGYGTGLGLPSYTVASTTATTIGAFGIATATPYGRLSVNSIAGDLWSFIVGSTTNPWLQVSNIGFGTTTVSGLNVRGSATSTSNVGFNITTGCYAVNGTCITSGGGGGGTFPFTPNVGYNSTTTTLGFLSNTGIFTTGSSTVAGQLNLINGANIANINTGSTSAGTVLNLPTTGASQVEFGGNTALGYAYGGSYFFNGSSPADIVMRALNGTGLDFGVDNGSGNANITMRILQGLVGIGTTTPYAQLSIGGGNLVMGAAAAGGTPGDFFEPKYGVAAGAFAAFDSTGKLISTTTPTSAGVSSIQQTYGSAQTGIITLATSTASFNGLTVADAITNTGGTFTITPLWSGTLSNAGLTNSTISGVALGGTLNSLTATNATLTFSGSYNGSAAATVGLNLNNANTWTALQQFTGASTTQLSSYGPSFFGATATTTINTAGNVGIGYGNSNIPVNLAINGTRSDTATLGGSLGATATENVLFTPTSDGIARWGIRLTSNLTDLSFDGRDRTSSNPDTVLYLSRDNRVAIASSSPFSTLGIGMSSTTPALVIGVAGSSTPAFVVSSANNSGNVGIGTSSPFTTFSVNGLVNLHGLSVGAGNGALCATTDGLVSYDAGTNCIPSSIRFKTDVQDLPDTALQQIDQLQPKSFFYKPGYGDNGVQEHIGLIAEDVAKVNTDLVVYDASGTPASLHFEEFNALYVQAIQDLQNEVQRSGMVGLAAKVNNQQWEMDVLIIAFLGYILFNEVRRHRK